MKVFNAAIATCRFVLLHAGAVANSFDLSHDQAAAMLSWVGDEFGMVLAYLIYEDYSYYY